jgi:hypothetical protein
VERGQHGGQVDDVQALEAADGQRPAQQPLDGGDGGAGGVDRAERAAGLDQQRPARLGQLDLPGAADEQRRAQLGLQRPDGRGQTRLGDVHAFGRPGEVALLGHRHEVLELTQLHDQSPKLLNAICLFCWTA